MSRMALEKRVAMLERKLGSRRQPVAKRSPRQTLAAEIDELERRLNAVSYMDDMGIDDMGMEEDIMELGMDDLEAAPLVDEATVVDEVGDIVEPAVDEGIDEFGISYMDDDAGLNDGINMGEELMMDEPMMEEDIMEEEEVYCGDFAASETSPGVEDRITQDYLSDVQGERHGEELATDDSILDAAPTAYKASEEYVSHLQRASARLDKVASYLEKEGRIELAERIDRIADAIDARINRRAQ